MIDWNAITREEAEIIRKIADRAWPVCRNAGVKVTRQDVQMDISAAHLTCPLRLAELLDAPDFDFAHDIGGIVRNINRQTGELENCFVPRFAQPYVLVPGGSERVKTNGSTFGSA